MSVAAEADEIGSFLSEQRQAYAQTRRRRQSHALTVFFNEEFGGQAGSQGAPADLTPPEVQQHILTEAGDFITTEAGDRITTL